jgi:8-amino-7-oxononanoate synthase
MSPLKGGLTGLTGLSAQIKDKLIQQSLERRLKQAGLDASAPAQAPATAHTETRKMPRGASDASQRTDARATVGDGHTSAAISEEFCRFDRMPGYKQIQIIHSGAQRMGLVNPFFKQHEGVASAHTQIAGQELINFSSYNYLNLSGDARINAAAMAAIEQYGTSVSASRLVSGERPIHRELEAALAALYEAEDAIVFVSGHATNVTTIGYLFGPRDLIVHDEYIHNSALEGIKLSGAKRFSFQHNDWQALDQLLSQHRANYERVLVVVEGIYSMDGDYPDLPKFVELRRRHQVFLMVDEAHSLGVMGARGHGIREHFGLQANDVDLWMGTLSKTLAGCGGYIAGQSALIEHLKFLAPGFLYSVGMSPPLAAASLAALQCLAAEQPRVTALQERGKYFLQLAQAAGINTGTSTGLAVVPAIIGSSIKATRLSSAMLTKGVNVQPILYPAVPEKSARLRFFMSCEHTEQEIEHTVAALADEIKKL